MKRISTLFSACSLAVMAIASCKSADQFALDDIVYVESFDSEARVPSELGEKVDLGLDGIQAFKIYGPYLLASSNSEEGMISVFNKRPPYEKLGSFFRKGNGPGELAYPISPSSFIYHTSDEGDIYAEINNRKGKIIRFDITESIREGKTVAEESGKAGKMSVSAINLGDDGVFFKDLSDELDAQIRYISKNDGQRLVTAGMERLNAAKIKYNVGDGSSFNVLTGSVCYDPSGKCFFETPGSINAIHVYSLDDSVRKTVCIGGKLYDYNEVARRPEADRPITSICTRLYDSYLAVLYLDVTAREYELEPWLPSLILYYWGPEEEFVRLFLPDKVNVFDIDPDNSTLYALDSTTESFYVYDLSNL